MNKSRLRRSNASRTGAVSKGISCEVHRSYVEGPEPVSTRFSIQSVPGHPLAGGEANPRHQGGPAVCGQPVGERGELAPGPRDPVPRRAELRYRVPDQPLDVEIDERAVDATLGGRPGSIGPTVPSETRCGLWVLPEPLDVQVGAEVHRPTRTALLGNDARLRVHDEVGETFGVCGSDSSESDHPEPDPGLGGEPVELSHEVPVLLGLEGRPEGDLRSRERSVGRGRLQLTDRFGEEVRGEARRERRARRRPEELLALAGSEPLGGVRSGEVQQIV